MNHAPAILTAPALIYSTHQVLIVWIIVANFHLCSPLGTLSCYTILEVSAVRWPMRVCCGSWWGWCTLLLIFWTVWRALAWCIICSVLFLSHPRSEGWPHHGRTFSIYLYPLSFWLTLPQGVLSISWSCLSTIQAVRGLPRLHAPGV